LKSDSEFQQSAERTRKEVLVGWWKLLDIELHELYRLIDTLVTNWSATGTIGT